MSNKKTLLMEQKSVVGNINWTSFYPRKASEGFAWKICSNWNVDKAVRCATLSRKTKLMIFFSLKHWFTYNNKVFRTADEAWSLTFLDVLVPFSWPINNERNLESKALRYSFLNRIIIAPFFGVSLLCSNNLMFPTHQEYQALNLCIVYKEMLHQEYIYITASTKAFPSGLFHPVECGTCHIGCWFGFSHQAYHHWLFKVCPVLNLRVALDDCCLDQSFI